MKKLFKREEGFTIIEVVLVLAIAGLIFLVVFLALPQLQRSRRDAQRKSDAGRFVAALESYAGNNNGNYPTCSGTAIQPTNFVSGYLTDGSTWADPSEGPYNAVCATTNTPDVTASSIGTMYYRDQVTCSATEGQFTAGSARDAAVLTPLEDGIAYCQDNR